MEIFKTYTFDSAHFLTKVPKEHPCRNLHGHTYTVIITIQGEVDSSGFVLDFLELDKVVKPIVALLDHSCLNEIIDNPTSENLTLFFLDKLKELPISKIVVQETPKTGAIWSKI
jgi:6-pyruvoyltetrahydropterin/6-carboxytetrahydropterin synthase